MWVGLVWFGLVEGLGFLGVDGLVSYITVISPFLFQIGLFVYWCRCYFVVSVLPSLTSSTAHFSLFFTFTSVIFFSLSLLSFFFFTFLLSLWSQVCVRCIKCIYISLGLFFFTSFLYLFSLPPFFFPLSLSLSLSVTRSLCIFRYLNNIHANEQNKIESRSEYARSAVSPCSRFTLF